jgi:2',3'-cyclic-nucleotide 2'-phosphodiesterase (5'-nucleotidase family)
MGIVEDEWLTTLAVDTSHFQYKDFSSEATRLAAELRADGADIIVVLSHMRQPNDQILAQTAKGIDIILGGHDHFYVNEVINGVPLVKSGTDFRWLSKVTASVVLGSSAPTFKIETIDITNEIPEEPTVKALVDKYQAEMSSKLCKVIGYSEVQLDARASTCRLKESNLGNFICDIMRHEYGADCTILNGGTIRSDDVYEGKFSIQSLLNILPFEDICVVVRVPGSAIRAALENGFSQLPKQEVCNIDLIY